MTTEDLPALLRFMWGRPGRSTRGPSRTLTAQMIGAAGVEVADADGIDGLSMASVAAKLSVSSMALYRYVESKDELLTVIRDHALGPAPRLTARSWRTRLEQWARAERAVLLAHPWAMRVQPNEPPVGPNTVAWMESGLSAFARADQHGATQLSVLLLVDVFVRGQTELAVNLGAADDRAYVERLRQLVTRESMPRMHAIIEGTAMVDNGDFGADEFAFGLARILDGVAELAESWTS